MYPLRSRSRRGLVSDLGSTTKDTLDSAGTVVVDALNGVGDLVKDTVDNVADTVGHLANSVTTQKIDATTSNTKKTATKAANTAAPPSTTSQKGLVGGIVGAVGEAVDDVGGVVATALKDVGQVVETVVKDVGGLVHAAVSDVGNVVSDVGDAMGGVLPTTTHTAKPTTKRPTTETGGDGLSSPSITIGDPDPLTKMPNRPTETGIGTSITVGNHGTTTKTPGGGQGGQTSPSSPERSPTGAPGQASTTTSIAPTTRDTVAPTTTRNTNPSAASNQATVPEESSLIAETPMDEGAPLIVSSAEATETTTVSSFSSISDPTTALLDNQVATISFSRIPNSDAVRLASSLGLSSLPDGININQGTQTLTETASDGRVFTIQPTPSKGGNSGSGDGDGTAPGLTAARYVGAILAVLIVGGLIAWFVITRRRYKRDLALGIRFSGSSFESHVNEEPVPEPILVDLSEPVTGYHWNPFVAPGEREPTSPLSNFGIPVDASERVPAPVGEGLIPNPHLVDPLRNSGISVGSVDPFKRVEPLGSSRGNPHAMDPFLTSPVAASNDPNPFADPSVFPEVLSSPGPSVVYGQAVNTRSIADESDEDVFASARQSIRSSASSNSEVATIAATSAFPSPPIHAHQQEANPFLSDAERLHRLSDATIRPTK